MWKTEIKALSNVRFVTTHACPLMYSLVNFQYYRKDEVNELSKACIKPEPIY